MQVHFFQTKGQLMSAFRKHQQPLEKFTPIQLFSDLCKFTMQKHKSLLPVTKALHNHSIPYHWGYHVKIAVTHEENTTVITCVEDGLTLLPSLDILPEQTTEGPPPSGKLHSQHDWQTVSKRKTTKNTTHNHQFLVISNVCIQQGS